jgi:hypothetical protein
MTQQERYEEAVSAMKQFSAKHGNTLIFPRNAAQRKLSDTYFKLQDAVSEAYWTDEMDAALKVTR